MHKVYFLLMNQLRSYTHECGRKLVLPVGRSVLCGNWFDDESVSTLHARGKKKETNKL
jgi:hypothetical protein